MSRRCCPEKFHPVVSNSPEASAHVQVQRKYGWEPSNRVCGARGAAAHACAPGLSTGRRLMPMPARCGAAAPCHGAATVRRSQHTRRVLLRVLLGSIQYSVMFIRGNGVTLRTQKVIQGGDNSHVGRPCEVSLAPPCPELFCELRGLCRHSYFGPRTCVTSEKPKSSKWRGPNPGFQRNPSPP
jgi:hypothetical protein